MSAFVTCLPVNLPFSSREQQSRTQRRNRTRTQPLACSPLIIGLNQYAHDASIAVIDASTSNLLFAQSKERISRRKHDGGDVSNLVFHALASLCDDPSEESVREVAKRVRLVVANNHHYPLEPFEKRFPFQISLNYIPQSYASPWNLLGTNLPFAPSYAPNARKVELSHHLAHAYSAVFHAPFDEGLVVIMDGMGDALEFWDPVSGRYYHENNFVDREAYYESYCDRTSVTNSTFREAETAYLFRRTNGHIKFTSVFKRWSPETEPSELYNHSFEEMDSIGALYSRVSAILFKDWNACGKVMGLAPHANTNKNPHSNSRERFFIKGNIYNETLNTLDGKLLGLDHLQSSMSDPEIPVHIRTYFEQLAGNIQADLEDVVINFVQDLLDRTGAENVVFAGGVALNSTLNGILSSMHDVKSFYVPPFPGDEGIAVGCAVFGRSLLFENEQCVQPQQMPSFPMMPYWGRQYNSISIYEALHCFSPWIKYSSCSSSGEEAARALAGAKVVAWFNGRSEFGPRALGNRSILADPRSETVRNHLNAIVKRREPFRPFAPSVLSEHVDDWFEECDELSSPFMSLTKRARHPQLIPAVVHVDGTSRLQTLSKADNPAFHGLISQFYDITGVPMVLNTSFNTAGMPIVEHPFDAIQCFLDADGIDMLLFPGLVVHRATQIESVREEDHFETAFAAFRSEVTECDGITLRVVVTYSREYSFEEDLLNERLEELRVILEDSLSLGILELIHSEEKCPVSKIYEEFVGEEPNNDDEFSKDVITDRIKDLFCMRLIFKST